MIIEIISALIFPCLLVLLFTRVTYNRIIGLVLTLALITTSVYKGYTHTWLIYMIDAFSITVGFWLADFMKQRSLKKS